MQRTFRIACLGVLTAAIGLGAASAALAERTAVVLVFDGVAAATLDVAPVPTFERLRAAGAWTHRMEPPFPSNSLVGGFSLSTGCWPSHHGIVNNRFLDPERGFYDHSKDADWLLGCQGLHEVAEAQGVRAAALGWYGSHSEERGRLASTVGEHEEDENPSEEERAGQVIEQLGRRDVDAPRLILAYFRGPDSQQHFSGMDSPETRAEVVRMDSNLAEIIGAIEALQESRPEREIALFMTTDHGMLPVTTIVNIERILKWHRIPARAVSTGSSAFLYFEEGTPPAEIERAAEALASYEEIEVLRPAALPAFARLGGSDRIGQLIVSVAAPYFIEDAELWPGYLQWMGRWGPRFAPAGAFLKATHGYAPAQEARVHGVLYAWGDGIAAGRKLEGMRAVDLHPTVLHWLGLAPGRPLDGRVAVGLFAD